MVALEPRVSARKFIHEFVHFPALGLDDVRRNTFRTVRSITAHCQLRFSNTASVIALLVGLLFKGVARSASAT